MSTYLITGAAGFIGSHLVQNLLEQGHKIINVDNFHDFYDYKIKTRNVFESLNKEFDFSFTNNKEKDLNKIKKLVQSEDYCLYLTDIRDIKKLKIIFQNHDIDCVIHLAALAGVRPSIDNPIEYEEVNIKGTMNLWTLCNKFKVNKFVNASSSSVYGNNQKIPFQEEDIVDFAISPYAATKKACEVMGHVYHSLFNIDMIHLRFFTVYGPRQRPDLAIHKFTNLIYNGKKIPFYGDGTTERDYTYIDDIIEGIVKSIDYVENNMNIYEIINLGENQTTNLNEMVESIEKLLNKKAKKNKLPMQAGDVQKTFASIEKAKQLIGYNPKTKFQEGIVKFIDWYKTNNE